MWVLLTRGRAARMAYTIEINVPQRKIVAGINSHGLESSFGATAAIMMEMMMPLMLIIMLAL